MCEWLPIDMSFSLAILENRCKPLNLNDSILILVGLLWTGRRDKLTIDATALEILWNEDCCLQLYITKHINFQTGPPAATLI